MTDRMEELLLLGRRGVEHPGRGHSPPHPAWRHHPERREVRSITGKGVGPPSREGTVDRQPRADGGQRRRVVAWKGLRAEGGGKTAMIISVTAGWPGSSEW